MSGDLLQLSPPDIISFPVCPSIEVRTSVLCFSQDLPHEMWQEIHPNQLKQKELACEA